MKHIFAFFAFAVTLSVLHAAPDGKDVPRPPRPPRHFQFPGNQKPDSHQNFWRIFSRLTPAEQKEMMNLQRTDPEKFRAAIHRKAEQIQAEQQLKRQKINELAGKIRNSKDEKEKSELRKELHSILKAGFDARLAQMRRNIDVNKKRIERMEAELKKREDNAEAIINASVDAVISGQKRPPHHGDRKPPRPRP